MSRRWVTRTSSQYSHDSSVCWENWIYLIMHLTRVPRLASPINLLNFAISKPLAYAMKARAAKKKKLTWSTLNRTAILGSWRTLLLCLLVSRCKMIGLVVALAKFRCYTHTCSVRLPQRMVRKRLNRHAGAPHSLAYSNERWLPRISSIWSSGELKGAPWVCVNGNVSYHGVSLAARSPTKHDLSI